MHGIIYIDAGDSETPCGRLAALDKDCFLSTVCFAFIDRYNRIDIDID
jgi:hypothetical protein